MQPQHDIYNGLPTLYEADAAFAPRKDEILEKIASLFATHPEFGLCLVHAHCRLEEGELMLERDNITEPIMFKDGMSPYFPARWRSDGVAYEFSSTSTKEPPSSLIKGLESVDADIRPYLGVYYVDQKIQSADWIERSEGRRNIVEKLPENHTGLTVQTNWSFENRTSGPQSHPRMVCSVQCNIASSRRGVYHLGSQTHVTGIVEN